MSTAVRPAWSPGQRERLAAMGLAVYVRAGEHRRPATQAAQGVGSQDDRLMRALLRAAGRPADRPGADDVHALLPPLDTLRGNPAAKRALWPKLRALRRGGRG